MKVRKGTTQVAKVIAAIKACTNMDDLRALVDAAFDAACMPAWHDRKAQIKRNERARARKRNAKRAHALAARATHGAEKQNGGIA